MLKVALNDGDEQYLNPIRMIVDETVAATGERRVSFRKRARVEWFLLQLDNCYIFGYGSESLYGPATLDLRLAPVAIISSELCTEKLGEYNAPPNGTRMFCAVGARPFADACAVSHFPSRPITSSDSSISRRATAAPV